MSDDRAELRGFGGPARAAVVAAETEARSLGHARVGTEHLLLGLLGDNASVAARVAKRTGASLAAARHMAAEAVHPARDGAPRGEMSTTPRASRALVRAVRFSHQAQADEVGTEHLLLGVLDVEGTASLVLRRIGVDIDELRAAMTALRAQGGDGAAEAPRRKRASGGEAAAAVCAGCGASLATNLVEHAVRATAAGGGSRVVSVFACAGCGRAIGATSN